MKKPTLFIFCLLTSILLAKPPKDESYTVDDILLKGINQISFPHIGSSQSTTSSSALKTKLKRFINSNLIIERSSQFSKISSFNSNINIADSEYFNQAITDIHIASNKKLYTDYKGLKKRIKKDFKKKNIVSVAILNTSFNKINYDKEDPLNPHKGYYLINNALVPIKGKTQFIPLHATVIAPLKKHLIGDEIVFKFNKDLIFTNGKSIKTLKADLGDGTYRTIIENGELIAKKIPISVSASKNTKQTYKIIYTDGKSLNTYSTVYIRSIANPPSIKVNQNYTRKDYTHISKYPFQGYTEDQPYRGQIDYRIYYGKENPTKKLTKPLFILEGFDPKDKRKLENIDYINPNDTLSSPPLFDKMIYGNDQNLIKTLNDRDYDVILCNFPTHYKKGKKIDGGADYVERNSLAFVSLLQEINKEIKDNKSAEQLVILGPSMGAIISRFALAYMEKKQAETNDPIWDHNTRLWVSMDGPHLGANIPIGIQSALYLAGYIGMSSGAKTSYDTTLKSTTAQQFLINQHKAGSGKEGYHFVDNTYMNGRVKEQGYTSESGSPFYQQFYRTLYNNGLPNSRGFPMNTRRIAIVNSNFKGNKIGSSSEQTVYMKGYVKLCMLWGTICSKMHVTTIGTWNMPSFGKTEIVAKFKKAFETKTTQVTNYSTRGNFDILSGGYTDTFNQITQQSVDSANNTWGIFDRLTFGISKLLRGELDRFKVYTNNKTHGFISPVSALAINTPERHWGEDLTNELYSNLTNFTPFENFFIPEDNENHAELTRDNVDWMVQEIEGTPYRQKHHNNTLMASK